ncbi:TAXI family TRAP transporter solute-binding subunit [Noviherbaspirillum aridicola]|nr:TAXI family TRAP transporter solute-binding subunit [Noviherbaspirillum aridicola]
MPKILPLHRITRFTRFTRFSLRDFIVAAGPAALAVLVTGLLAYWLVDPAPPKKIVMATGQENSAYEALGRRYAEALRQYDVELELRPTLGSRENLERLRQPDSGVDVGFVQSGSTAQEDAQRNGLVSLGSLFTEPVWLFTRKDVTRLSQLKGMRINVGPEGTGLPGLFRTILSVNGVEPDSLRLRDMQNTPATVALLEGRIDGLVFSSSPDAPLIQMLLQTPGIRLFDFAQAQAYTRRFPFLTHVTLPRGIVDLGRDIPSRDFQLIAPTATLVAHESLHPALVDLLVQTAASVHGGAGWFQKQGEFPTASYSEIPVAEAAVRFYQGDKPFLQRYLPFWLANFLQRMWVVVVALGALIIPLSRIIPPLYVWKVRSRVYRWYGQLREVEQAVDEAQATDRAEVYGRQLQRLNEIEERVNRISIPLSFADELYGLRSHINFVRRRLLALMPQAGRAAQQ